MLCPKNYLKNQGITEIRDTNQIANYALVEWADNIDISDMPPSEYLPKYAIRFSKTELEEMFYWHALPQDWERMRYDDFLTVRRKAIAKVIRDGFNKLLQIYESI